LFYSDTPNLLIMSSPSFKQFYLPEKNGFDSLTLRTVPREPPKFGQILVRIKAVSLNWRDCILAIGTYPFPGPDALVPGSDGAGTILPIPHCQQILTEPGIVEEVGEGVTEWKVGDRVLANFTQDHIGGRLTPTTLMSQLGGETQGLLGEYFCFPKTGVVKIPDYLSFEEASCLPCAALTAWNALYGLIPLRAGQVVVLQGTGGVSTLGLQIAHAAGATTIVTSSSDEKLEGAKKLGATYGINYRTNPDWAKEVKRITNGKGADHIIEVGGTLTLQASFDAIGFHGCIHSIGHITNPDPLRGGKDLKGPDAAFLALDRLCILRGVVVGSREQLEDLLACFAAGEIRPVIDRVFDFEDTKKAYEYLWKASHTGKVVIRIP
jgi:NADPH:quinone reductase-like Zn-dependent oxidoreductase